MLDLCQSGSPLSLHSSMCLGSSTSSSGLADSVADTVCPLREKLTVCLRWIQLTVQKLDVQQKRGCLYTARRVVYKPHPGELIIGGLSY